MLLGGIPQPFAQFLGALGYVREPLEQRAQIQTRTYRENRQPFSPAQVLQRHQCQFTIAACRSGLTRIEHIDQVMRDSPAFLNPGLGGSDVEPAIQLRGIARYHFPTEPLGEPHS